MVNNLETKRILFIDLDDTLIKTISTNTFPVGIWDMRLNLKLLSALDYLKEAAPIDYIFIVSNQGGIPQYVNRERFVAKIQYVSKAIEDYLNMPEQTVVPYFSTMFNIMKNEYTKPNIGMLTEATSMLKLISDEHYVKEDMFMIGDASGKEGNFSDSDKKCAENFGIDYIDVNDFIEYIDSIKDKPSDVIARPDC